MSEDRAPLRSTDVLIGKTVRLRPPCREEMAFVRRLWADPETMAAVGGPILLSDQQADDWYAAKVDPGRPTDCYFLILNAQDEPVGEISFHRLDPATKTADLNVKVAARRHGKGYARDALQTFLEFFFSRFGGRVLTDRIALDNHPGQRLLLRAGFQHDPTVRDVFLVRMPRQRYDPLRSEGS